MVPLRCRSTDYCDRVVEAIDSAVGFSVLQHAWTESISRRDPSIKAAVQETASHHAPAPGPLSHEMELAGGAGPSCDERV